MITWWIDLFFRLNLMRDILRLVDSSLLFSKWFYDLIFGLCVGLVSLVIISILVVCLSSRSISHIKNIEWLEFTWTLVPIIILLMLSVPSFHLLYTSDSFGNRVLYVRVTGHQWFWSYSLDGFENTSFDSFILSSDLLEFGDYRLLEVDNSLVLPHRTWVCVSVTRRDVLHSWSIPSIRIKLDSIPLHFNTSEVYSPFRGKISGLCSELCGRNHSFIPIRIEFVNINPFKIDLQHY